MKTIRNFQPCAALILFICGFSFAFGQSASPFNVTVTESSAGGCSNPPCIYNLYFNTDFSEFCLPDGVGGGEGASVVNASFSFTVLSATSQSGDSHPEGVQGEGTPIVHGDQLYRISGQVFGIDNYGNEIPTQLANSSVSNTLTAYGSSGIFNPQGELTLSINMDFIDNGYCYYIFRFDIFEVLLIGQIPNFIYNMEDIVLNNCNCAPDGRQTGGTGETGQVWVRDGRKTANLNSLDLNLFPNPLIGDQLLIEFNGEESLQSTSSETEINVLNLHGQMLKATRLNTSQQQGKISQKLNLQGIAPGIYFLEVKNERFREVKRFIVK